MPPYGSPGERVPPPYAALRGSQGRDFAWIGGSGRDAYDHVPACGWRESNSRFPSPKLGGLTAALHPQVTGTPGAVSPCVGATNHGALPEVPEVDRRDLNPASAPRPGRGCLFRRAPAGFLLLRGWGG